MLGKLRRAKVYKITRHMVRLDFLCKFRENRVMTAKGVETTQIPY